METWNENVWDSGWKTAPKSFEGNAKIVRHSEKVRDSGVRDTERIYKGSYR